MLAQPMKMSDAGLAMTQKFEGEKLTAYQDPVGVWTIGYGHTGADVHAGLVWTSEQAGIALLDDMEEAENAVNQFVCVGLSQSQFDALCDFAYNAGINAFRKSTLLFRLNQGDYAGGSAQFNRWIYAGPGKVLPGLVARRQAETDLFNAA